MNVHSISIMNALKFESNKYQRNHTYGYIIEDILKALIVYISIAIKHHVVKISKKAVTIILVKYKLNTYTFFFVHLKKKKWNFYVMEQFVFT